MPDKVSVPASGRPSRWRVLSVCALAGAAGALGNAPVSLPAVSLSGFALGLLMVSIAPEPSAAARRGWLFATGYFVVTLHWIVEPFLVDVARHGWMAPFALILLSGGLALFWGAAAWAGARLVPRPGARRLLALALLLFFAELARSFLFTGFPWALPGYIWINTPIAALASYVGVHGLTLATLLAAALAAWAVAPTTRKPVRWRVAGTLAVLLVAGWVFGGDVQKRSGPAGTSDQPVIRIVQPNAAQHLKWRSDQIPIFWERKIALTALPSEPRPDIVIWPEVTLPYILGSRPIADAEVVEAAGGVPVLVGAQRFEGEDLRNAVAVLKPDGSIGTVYDKQHLVPFGEYFPGGALAARLGLQGLATSVLGGFTPGSGSRVLDLTEFGLGHALALICYEAIFPRHARNPKLRPDWIVQSTNDAWFGNFAGPQQHLDHARMRAIEQGLPLVRVANTGISALIDPHGRILDRLDLGQEGAIDVVLPPPLEATVYFRLGGWAIIPSAFLLLVLLCLPYRRNGD